jgi:hypothetical protein
MRLPLHVGAFALTDRMSSLCLIVNAVSPLPRSHLLLRARTHRVTWTAVWQTLSNFWPEMTGQTSVLPSICLLAFTAFLRQRPLHVNEDEEILDINFCLQKEAEYCTKARSANNLKIRSTYEAVAREFAYRAKLLKEKKRP